MVGVAKWAGVALWAVGVVLGGLVPPQVEGTVHTGIAPSSPAGLVLLLIWLVGWGIQCAKACGRAGAGVAAFHTTGILPWRAAA